MRFNGYHIRAMREVSQTDPLFGAFVDMTYGPPRAVNDYETLSRPYQATDTKPDKQYSTLPTVLTMLGDCRGERVLDLGCGSGFFTRAIAATGVASVIGIDNSVAQLEQAHAIPASENVSYTYGDVFKEALPACDAIVAPYIPNYAKTVNALGTFFQSCASALSAGGRLVLVVDMPTGRDLRRFGAVKHPLGYALDEIEIRIDLFDKDQVHTCTLYATHFTKSTITRLLRSVGFQTVTWHDAIVSPLGIEALGAEFWNGYLPQTDLGYVLATR